MNSVCVTGFSFATLVYLVLDADAATCRFASAGHLPPLVVEEDGHAVGRPLDVELDVVGALTDAQLE